MLCQCGCGQETKLSTIKRNVFNKYIKGHNSPWLGLKRPPSSDVTKQKQRDSHLGKKHNVSDTGREQSRINVKRTQAPDSLAKMAKSLTGRKLSPEHIKKSRRSGRPTSIEKKMIQILSDLQLPYKYTGDGTIKIDRLNPDFVNINGEKIAIEVYAKIYKEIGDRTISGWKQERQRRFGIYGWKIFFFDESQVNKQFVSEVLGGGSH